MSRARSSIIRAIRLQLKSGYMLKEPNEYLFLKRYPPINRDTKPTFHKTVTKNIPYFNLLEKMADRNIAYDERVYPAYWQQEPIGLTLAKKQHQFMMAGDDEETAFQKAEAYVDQLENKAYMEAIGLHSALKNSGAQTPFMKEESIANEILMWQEKLKKTPYHMLESADQGEIDFMIQTKILKWNEVERERRMRDPIFVRQFRKLRRQLFPEDQQYVEARGKVRARMEKVDYLQSKYSVDYGKVRAAAPFYLEDYVTFFNKVKAEPNIRKWTLEDRSAVSTWIINTLAIREVLENSSNEDIQSYLDTLKIQFFPMISQPTEAHAYEAPTVDSLRKLLYENDIGYKTDGGKVFVKRFYSIPKLLFPTDTFATALVDDLDFMEPNEEDGEDEVHDRGDASDLTSAKDRLQAYVTKYKMTMPDYTSTSAGSVSPLDALIDDATRELGAPNASVSGTSNADADKALQAEVDALEREAELVTAEYRRARAEQKARAQAEKDAAFEALSEEQKMAALDEEVDALLKEDGIYSRNKTAPKPKESEGGNDFSSSSSGSDDAAASDSDSSDSSSDDDEGTVAASAAAVVTRAEKDEFAVLMRKYRKPAATELDRARDAYYDTEYMFDQATDEVDLQTFRDDRTSFEFEERARLEALYKEKEEARVAREWSKRGLWEMPRPHIPVIGVNKV